MLSAGSILARVGPQAFDQRFQGFASSELLL